MSSGVLSEIDVEGTKYGFTCSLLKGSCSSASTDWVKNIVITSDGVLVPGMLMSIQFEHGNTVGDAVPRTLYSSDQITYYTDSALTQAFELAPEINRTITYTGTGNVYTYYSFPVLRIGDATYIVKDSRGHYAGKGCWNDGDKMIFFFDGEDACIQNSDVRQVQTGYTIYSDGTNVYNKQSVDTNINSALSLSLIANQTGVGTANFSIPSKAKYIIVISSTPYYHFSDIIPVVALNSTNQRFYHGYNGMAQVIGFGIKNNSIEIEFCRQNSTTSSGQCLVYAF